MGLHKRYFNGLDHENSHNNKRNVDKMVDCSMRHGATKVLRETRRGGLRFSWLIGMAALGCIVIIVSLYNYGLRVHRCRVNRKKGPENADGFQIARPEYQSGFQLVKTLKRPVDMCALKLGFGQIALLYLLKGNVMFHEDMWRSWFVASAGKIPILQQGQMCRGKKLANMDTNDLNRYCHVQDKQVSKGKVIEKQHLYDVWVHIPRYVDANIVDSSIFAPYVLPKEFRVDANWGSHSLIDATRVLYAAALTNPLNSKFVLISEADVPLYSSLVVYRQLVSEEKSRINACNVTVSKDWSWNPNEGYRLRPDMLEAGMSPEMWRKSWQWTSLLRKHARSVVQDRDIDDLFRTYCRPRWDESWCDFRVCYSDEHYIPTLFSSLGLDNETDCAGELTGALLFYCLFFFFCHL